MASTRLIAALAHTSRAGDEWRRVAGYLRQLEELTALHGPPVIFGMVACSGDEITIIASKLT